ncbi:glycoside hydrolase family 3 C-terminal domain-containing protein [Sphingomonas sp. DG1-23]|uniref:glycoside hydrolase family 3 protein n=1 Tax=Sphingomonas sp. DG1-23 TaxID=3068316 RepID=UPI0027401F4D|nr:glycoside hydrolase family 3 protein [Sphingomonas sp. DG1-23]MDP5280389.1 glycoside hydrolase family 3 C-terminal domain-containing protein [Sphingomonas sp. DG1-23]
MTRKLVIALALTTPGAWVPLASAQTAAAGKLGDPSATPEQRARDVIARMTLQEKAHQLGHTAPAIPRLGVPRYNWWNEGLHGVARAGIATVFPQAIGMAASWDAPLLHQVGDTIATEFRAKYVERRHPDGGSDFYRGLTVWSPNINIFRDPRWGRGQETYGEDPYLSGRLGIAFITGLQGNDPKFLKTVATSKHFAVHSGPESNRHREDVHPSPHDLEDTYLPAFRATVTEGKVESVMCVYNAVNGVPGCASSFLMDDILRKSWGFKGYVVSDCGAAANIYREDALHYTRTAVEGVAVGIKAGMDLICGDYRNKMTTEPENIVAAVKAGQLPEAVVDRALQRLFEARIRLGLFDPQLPFANITAEEYDTPGHHALSRKMAEASMVLLKNEGDLLPIKGEPKTIAVIGPNADSFDALVGNYYGTPSKPVTVLDGIRARYPKARILHVQGTGLIGPAEVPVPDDALCVDAACAARGLKVEFFEGANLEGAATESSTQPNARFEWRGDRESSARWTGTLVAPESGEYGFRFASENGYRIWVDDKLVVDEWGVGDAPSILSGTIALEKGRKYPLRVEGFQRGQRSSQQLVWSLPSADGDHAVAAAKQADLVIFVGGLSARIEGEEMKVQAPGFAGGDRTSLDLPAPQQKLLAQLHAVGKPTVLVLMNGSALAVNWADAHVPAIVEAWYPGGEGGHAVAGLLAGDFSPAGRLPVTFYRSADQLPPFSDYRMAGRTYRYFAGEPLYPFGHGLSYTRFRYGTPTLSNARVGADGKVTVTVEISNIGTRDGDEVAQLYVSHPGTSGAPVRALERFERVHLKKGETRRVRFALDARALSLVDAEGIRRLVPGRVDLWIGGGQPTTRAGLPAAAGVAARLEVTAGAVLPK